MPLDAIRNLFEAIPPPGTPDELTETLGEGRDVRIERIVSRGHASPPGFWYDQPEAEFVLVVRGEAMLRFEDEPEARQLVPGDHVVIAPHRRHRVESTTDATVWLTVFFTQPSSPSTDQAADDH